MNRTALGLRVGLLVAAVACSSSVAAEPTDGPARPSTIELDDQQKAVGQVIVLHATNDGKGIDPSIGDLPELKRPPFSAYDSYKLLERGSIDLAPSGAMNLPDGGKLDLRLEAAEGDRYTVVASVTKKGGKKFLPGAKINAKKGEYFFLAGQKYKDGILVLGIRILPK